MQDRPPRREILLDPVADEWFIDAHTAVSAAHTSLGEFAGVEASITA